MASTFALVLAGAARAPSARAQVVEAPMLQTPSERLAGGNLGTSLSLASGLCVPPEGGRLGLPLAAALHYGIALGPTILAPGVRVASLFVPGAVGLAGLAELRFTLPLTPLAPYFALGVGPGYRSAPAQLGLAFEAAPGLMVALTERLSVGLEASYFQIVGTHFRRLSFGPSLTFGL